MKYLIIGLLLSVSMWANGFTKFKVIHSGTETNVIKQLLEHAENGTVFEFESGQYSLGYDINIANKKNIALIGAMEANVYFKNSIVTFLESSKIVLKNITLVNNSAFVLRNVVDFDISKSTVNNSQIMMFSDSRGIIRNIDVYMDNKTNNNTIEIHTGAKVIINQVKIKNNNKYRSAIFFDDQRNVKITNTGNFDIQGNSSFNNIHPVNILFLTEGCLKGYLKTAIIFTDSDGYDEEIEKGTYLIFDNATHKIIEPEEYNGLELKTSPQLYISKVQRKIVLKSNLLTKNKKKYVSLKIKSNAVISNVKLNNTKLRVIEQTFYGYVTSFRQVKDDRNYSLVIEGKDFTEIYNCNIKNNNFICSKQNKLTL